MKRTGKPKRKNILISYLITYFSVMLIPLTICCVYYLKIVSTISKDDIREKTIEMKHAEKLVDTMMDEIVALGKSLTTDSSVNQFKALFEPFQYPGSYQIIRLRDQLPDLRQTNQALFQYFIFFENSQLVMNSESVYTWEEFYQVYMHPSDCGTYEEWKEEMLNDELKFGLEGEEEYKYIRENKEIRLLTYTQPLLNTGGGGMSQIKIYFEPETLDTLMPAMPEGGIRMVLNGKGELLYLDTGSTEVSERVAAELALEQSVQPGLTSNWKTRLSGYGDYRMIRTISEDNGLIYCGMYPENVLNRRTVSSMMMIIVVILLAVAVGGALCFHMSRKSAVPINRILRETSRMLKGKEQAEQPEGGLNGVFQYLLRNSSELGEALESQKPLVRNAFFGRLIFGDYIAEEEILRTARYLGIELEKRKFWIVIFRFGLMEKGQSENSSLQNTCNLALMEILEQQYKDGFHMNSGEDRTVMMMSGSESENYREFTREMVEKIWDGLPENIAHHLEICVGNPVGSLTELSDSYRNAAFLFQGEQKQEILWYQKNEEIQTAWPAAEVFAGFTHYVVSGNTKGLHDALETMVRKYLFQENPSVCQQQMLLSELQTGFFRIVRQMNLQEEDYRRYCRKLEELWGMDLIRQLGGILNLYQELCQEVCEQKESTDAESIAASAAAYIDANYGDSGLSLTGIADMFSISETYLSNLFRQVLGINFSVYVEKIRMEKAKELLIMTDMTVSDISACVGYCSSNSFCRAFRRVTGISASQYRKERSGQRDESACTKD